MPRGKEFSTLEIENILRLNELGVHPAVIAEGLSRPRTSVYNIIKSGGLRGQRRSGRPRKLSEHSERRLYRAASNKVTSAKALKNMLHLDVSSRTVLRSLNRNPNFVWKKKLKRVKMIQRHADVRMAWCGERNLWVDEWKRIIWSDEKKFNLDGPDGLSYYWHDIRKEELYFSSRQRGGASVMVWAAFGFNGRTPIRFIDGRLNAQGYCQVLQQGLWPHRWNLADAPMVFQQDNAPVHTARVTKQWLQQRNVLVLPWPAKSPDLNPIENLWGIVVREVYKEGRQYNDTNELKAAITAAWQAIPQQTLQNLVRSMPSRTDLVMEANGWEIEKY